MPRFFVVFTGTPKGKPTYCGSPKKGRPSFALELFGVGFASIFRSGCYFVHSILPAPSLECEQVLWMLAMLRMHKHVPRDDNAMMLEMLEMLCARNRFFFFLLAPALGWLVGWLVGSSAHLAQISSKPN